MRTAKAQRDTSSLFMVFALHLQNINYNFTAYQQRMLLYM